MYGIFTYIYHKNPPNVGKYTIHGWYGYVFSNIDSFGHVPRHQKYSNHSWQLVPQLRNRNQAFGRSTKKLTWKKFVTCCWPKGSCVLYMFQQQPMLKKSTRHVNNRPGVFGGDHIFQTNIGLGKNGVGLDIIFRNS